MLFFLLLDKFLNRIFDPNVNISISSDDVANAIPDLEKACHWCKSEHEFLTAILELSDGGRNFVRGIQNNSHTQEFLKKYVLHHRDCVKRSVSFLSSVCKNGMAVEEWERSMTADD